MTITLTDLIKSLRKAAADPKNHASAQEAYFSEANENSVLVHCETACCIAGDLLLQERLRNNASQKELISIISGQGRSPQFLVSDALMLSKIERDIAFAPNTHHELHTLLADLLEAGWRLDSELAYTIHVTSTYTDFTYAELEGKEIDLGQLKSWLCTIVK